MKTVLIVQPVSSAEYLAKALKKAGIRSVALYFQNPYLHKKHVEGIFDVELHCDDTDSTKIIQKLAPYPIDYVINGNEFYTAISDSIAELLTPGYANDASTSHFRYDKYWMQECLRRHHLPNIQHIKISRHTSDYDLFKDLHYPVFIKPVNAAASVGGAKAHTFDELLHAITSKPEYFDGGSLDEFVVQEFIDGVELVVDSFSVQNRHAIAGIYQYQKALINNVPVYQYCEVVHDAHLSSVASAFTQAALSACEMHNGFAHTEIFISKKGPYLVEINPRINGAKGATNKIGQRAGLNPQDAIFINWLKFDCLHVERILPKKYARWIAVYQPISKNLPKCHIETIPMNHNPSGGLDFTNVHDLVLIASEDRDEIEFATQEILRLNSHEQKIF